MPFDYASSPNLYGSADAPRASAGVGSGKAKGKAERVLYETAAKMHSVRDALPGSGPGGFPEPGELLRLTTFSDINALTIILRAVEVFGTVDEMYAAVYSINQRAVAALRALVAGGQIARAVILGSDTITWRDPARIREMWEAADAVPALRFGMADNHAKTYGFACTDAGGTEHRIVCTTSANLASNARIEDYVITNSEAGYAHLVGWVEEIMQPLPEPIEEVET